MYIHLPENADPLRELREKLRQGSRDSFQLLENFWDNPICSIGHDQANHCIKGVTDGMTTPRSQNSLAIVPSGHLLYLLTEQ